MEVIEIRDLDGPNLFRMEPVIKIGLALEAGNSLDEIVPVIERRVRLAHDLANEPHPSISFHRFDRDDELTVAFDWRWRRFALTAARFAVEAQYVEDDPQVRELMLERLAADKQENDRPEWVRDDERTVRSVGITGTNGKTTTTRLLAHIAAKAAKHVGWSSSTGVYINGRQVLEGDYSGPSGARRVLQDPDVELAMLETARGGLLLRGLAYESNDVSVFLNVTADHLSLHGIDTVESLAEVKGIVVRVTRPEGLVVLSADDPLVFAFRDRVKAPVLLVSQRPEQLHVRQHIAGGGMAVVREDDVIVLYREDRRETVARVDEIPITFGGAAPFMIENAMAATGAALGLGFSLDQIVVGLKTFRSDSSSNKGRLNVFDLDGSTVVIDYAHNDVGLAGLARFSRRLTASEGKLHLIVGTAGDRRDEDFLALGRIARNSADCVYIKDTPGYLRGREPGDMPALMREGFDAAEGKGELAGAFDNEFAAFLAALDESKVGDVVAVMCQVDQDLMIDEIERRGGKERTGSG